MQLDTTIATKLDQFKKNTSKLASYKYFWGSSMVVAGLVLCLAGKSLMNLLIFAIPAAIVASLGAYYTFQAMEKTDDIQSAQDVSPSVFWTVVGIWGIFGVLFGFLA